MDNDMQIIDDDFLFYSLLYSSITVLFAMAVLSKFVQNELRFGVRSVLSLAILFVGEPMCHFLLKGAAGVAFFGVGCLFVYSILPASHLKAKGKAVLITGCDSGFGHEVVKKLDSIGMRVFAGCLFHDGPGAIRLTNSCSERMTIVQMDITKEEQVDNVYQLISQEVGEEGLWGVVNNAGIWYVAELEMTPDAVLRRVLDVNLLGTIRVTRRFLPLIKKARGRVVNMTSVAGKVGFEGMGCYTMSKFALEGYTDTLRLEMKKWGVTVATIEPSGYKTAAVSDQTIQSQKEEVWKHMDEQMKQEYGREYFNSLYHNFSASVPKYPEDLTPVVRAVRSGLLSKRPLQRYVVGRGAGTLLTLMPVLPVWLADRIAHQLGTATSHDTLPAALKQQQETQGTQQPQL